MKKGAFTPPHNCARFGLDLVQDTILLTHRPHSAASVYPLKKNTIQSRNQKSGSSAEPSGRVERKLLGPWGRGLIGSKVHRTGLGKLSKFAQEVAKRENKQRGAG